MEMGENMEEIHPNFLIMPCDKLISEIWLLQGHCKPWLLNSHRSNPKLTLPFGGSKANSFLGKEGSGALNDHRANSSLLPGCAWKLSPGTKRLIWERRMRGRSPEPGGEWPQRRAGVLNLLPPSLKCLFVPSWSKVLAGILFLFFSRLWFGSSLALQIIRFSLPQRDPGWRL